MHAYFIYQVDGDDAIDRSVKELSQRDCDDGISLSEKRIISPSCRKNGPRIVKATLRSIYCGLLLSGQFCLNSVKR